MPRWAAKLARICRVPRKDADERTARSESLLEAISRSNQGLLTRIPNRLAERLRVGNACSAWCARVLHGPIMGSVAAEAAALGSRFTLFACRNAWK